VRQVARRGLRGFFLITLSAIVCGAPALAQAPQTPNEHSQNNSQIDTPEPKAAATDSDSLSGIVVDQTGTVVAGAKVKLLRKNPTATQEVVSGDDGRFTFERLVPGAFELTITAEGFAPQTTSGELKAGESEVLPPMTLALATVVAEVHVGLTPIEIAQEQLQEQEQQRVFGFVPNFYVSYIPNAAPLNTRQKFNLAWKTTVDPVSFGLIAVSAGVQQASDEFEGYGQGAQGYAKRYGASYADFVIGTYIGGAILPSLLKQDPRYFYKGTGTKKSRVMYAIANAVICKGDNGHWQPNYSGILGSIAAGGISNLYYPPGERGASLIFENTLIGIGTTAGANLLQEFLIRKLTPNLPNHGQATP
jgi:Carboxypeptidase regulatory-like domain